MIIIIIDKIILSFGGTYVGDPGTILCHKLYYLNKKIHEKLETSYMEDRSLFYSWNNLRQPISSMV